MAQPTDASPSTTTSHPPDEPMPDAPTANSTTSKKRKRDKKEKESHILHTSTIRNPPWKYFHLRFLPIPSTTSQPASSTPLPQPSAETDLDALTTRANLTAPLTQFLGTHGAAVGIDILALKGMEVWIRVPREEGRVVAAALSGWVGKAGAWRILGSGGWLGGLCDGGNGGGGRGVVG